MLAPSTALLQLTARLAVDADELQLSVKRAPRLRREGRDVTDASKFGARILRLEATLNEIKSITR